jgi:alpha-L-fucosidase
MTLNRRTFLAAPFAAAAPFSFAAVPPPAPYGALPSERQLRWHELEFYSFLHFTTNTFTDKEWGYGDESPSIFNPTAFDPDAIVKALKAGGVKATILTCKHHDGFCLWPTKTTEHCVRNSSWMGGKGDVVRAISDAARRHGLKFGIYLSPWDRNNPKYGKPEYVAIYREQLRELLTGYGDIFEVWHDGANGGDGFYGGAREKRTIDKHAYYDWPNTWALVRKLQPNAVIFSDVGPDIRWVGNEKGFANETSWATYDPVGVNGDAAAPGYTRSKEGLTGHRNGTKWLPAECDVSIRKGWFWHEIENGTVKQPRELMDLYYKSVGRGASFLLNVPPDRRGLLHEDDIKSLAGFGEALRATFKQNLAEKAKVTASNVRGNDKAFGPKNILNGNRATYWSTDDAVKTAEVTLDLGRPATFNVVRLREAIQLGQRIDSIALDRWKDGAWSQFAEATSIGACRIVRTKENITAARLRLRITQAAACPALSEFGVYVEAPL